MVLYEIRYAYWGWVLALAWNQVLTDHEYSNKEPNFQLTSDYNFD